MFDRVFTVCEYDPVGSFTAAGVELTPIRLPHYTLETYGFRLTVDGKTIAYSGDSGRASTSSSSPATRISSSARRPCSTVTTTACAGI